MTEIKTDYATIIKSFPNSIYKSVDDLTPNQEKTINLFVDFLKGKTFTLNNFEFLGDVANIVETQGIMNIFPDKIAYDKINYAVKDALKKSGIEKVDKISGIILEKTFGFGKLGKFIRDPELEEIMVNGVSKNVFVYHRKHGMCKTNIEINKNELKSFINKVAKTVDKEFNGNNPFLDARLSDGSRVNATYDTVTPDGITLTIRKFTQQPLSITKLIDNKAVSSEVAAFLWLCVEGLGLNAQNILIIGGTGTGKTTTLIALTSFIPYTDRILTIEDTPEINLQDRDNWITMEARTKTQNTLEVTMDDLLRNSLRMRPDRIIVGEVRGVEAQTLFTAMDTGHDGIIGTLHANNPKESIIRLKSEPMNVPENNLPLLNIIINMKKHHSVEKGLVRQIAEIAELERMDNQVLISNIYEKDVKGAEIKKTNVPNRTIEYIAESVSATKADLMDELIVREKILRALVEEKVFDYLEVTKVIQKYYEDPEEFAKEFR